jgi:hypothetical protein
VQSRRIGQIALTAFFLVGIAAAAHAQLQFIPPTPTLNPTQPFALPTTLENPVSPTDPGTLPGMSGPTIGTNPITGLPCTGGGSSAVDGGDSLPGATPPTDQNSVGLPPVGSVYGLGNEADIGAC